jgi:hypothetical protein
MLRKEQRKSCEGRGSKRQGREEQEDFDKEPKKVREYHPYIYSHLLPNLQWTS